LSRTRRLSTSPSGRGRRSASQHKGSSRNGIKSRGSSAHGSFAEDPISGYSDSEGGHGSISGSRKARSEQFASSEISMDNIVQESRRKKPKFESSVWLSMLRVYCNLFILTKFVLHRNCLFSHPHKSHWLLLHHRSLPKDDRLETMASRPHLPGLHTVPWATDLRCRLLRVMDIVNMGMEMAQPNPPIIPMQCFQIMGIVRVSLAGRYQVPEAGRRCLEFYQHQTPLSPAAYQMRTSQCN
jgi:hypothetical protein